MQRLQFETSKTYPMFLDAVACTFLRLMAIHHVWRAPFARSGSDVARWLSMLNALHHLQGNLQVVAEAGQHHSEHGRRADFDQGG